MPRARSQSAWVLVGALDFSRLILRQDGQGSRTDHLAEPWAVPLQESRMSTFLAAENGVNQGGDEGLHALVLGDDVARAFHIEGQSQTPARRSGNDGAHGGRLGKVGAKAQHVGPDADRDLAARRQGGNRDHCLLTLMKCVLHQIISRSPAYPTPGCMNEKIIMSADEFD